MQAPIEFSTQIPSTTNLGSLLFEMKDALYSLWNINDLLAIALVDKKMCDISEVFFRYRLLQDFPRVKASNINNARETYSELNKQFLFANIKRLIEEHRKETFRFNIQGSHSLMFFCFSINTNLMGEMIKFLYEKNFDSKRRLVDYIKEQMIQWQTTEGRHDYREDSFLKLLQGLIKEYDKPIILQPQKSEITLESESTIQRLTTDKNISMLSLQNKIGFDLSLPKNTTQVIPDALPKSFNLDRHGMFANVHSSPEIKIDEIPEDFCCPITCDLMKNPVKIKGFELDKRSYEYSAIAEWFRKAGKNESPFNREIAADAPSEELFIPDEELKKAIQDWRNKNAAAISPRF